MIAAREAAPMGPTAMPAPMVERPVGMPTPMMARPMPVEISLTTVVASAAWAKASLIPSTSSPSWAPTKVKSWVLMAGRYQGRMRLARAGRTSRIRPPRMSARIAKDMRATSQYMVDS